MQYDVSVQGNFYKTIEAPNTGAALSAVSNDIANGLVPNFDPDADHDIVLTPKQE